MTFRMMQQSSAAVWIIRRCIGLFLKKVHVISICLFFTTVHFGTCIFDNIFTILSFILSHLIRMFNLPAHVNFCAPACNKDIRSLSRSVKP